MKKLLLITSIAFASCGDSRNEQMTNLINQKKITEDSIKTVKYLEDDFYNKAKKEMRASNDSLKYKPLVDSSTIYYMAGYRLKKNLKAIDFSIDSLSKMK